MNELKEWLTILGTAIAVMASGYALYRSVKTSRREAKKQLAEEAAAAKKAEEEAEAKILADAKEQAEREHLVNEAGLTMEEFIQQTQRELLGDLREQVVAAGARASAAERRADELHDRMDEMGKDLRGLRRDYEKAQRQIGEMFDHMAILEAEAPTPPGPRPRPAHWANFGPQAI